MCIVVRGNNEYVTGKGAASRKEMDVYPFRTLISSSKGNSYPGHVLENSPQAQINTCLAINSTAQAAKGNSGRLHHLP